MSFFDLNMCFFDYVLHRHPKDAMLFKRGDEQAMSSYNEPKSYIFRENPYSFAKLHAIGYNDFSKNNTCDFWTTNVWNALYFVQSGHGSITVRGCSFNLTPGCLYFIVPNEPVKYHSEETDPVRYYWFAMYPDFAAEIREILGFTEDRPIRAANASRKIERLFETLFEARSATSETYFLAVSTLMQILSTEFTKVNAFHSDAQQEAFVQNVKQLIELNYTNAELHIDTIAQMLYISHSHMSRIFKKMTGITPVNYLTEVRLNHAGRLLQEKNCTVRELCAAVGFVDEWHFMKCFKKKFGMTVGEYRKQHTV